MAYRARARFWVLPLLLLCLGLPAQLSLAQSDIAPIMRLLKSGRLPKERIGNVVDLVCQRGSADDLAYVFE